MGHWDLRMDRYKYLRFGHAVVSRCEHTTNARVNVQHHRHRYEEWAHCREYDISFVVIVAALDFARFTIMTTGLVPTNDDKNH